MLTKVFTEHTHVHEGKSQDTSSMASLHSPWLTDTPPKTSVPLDLATCHKHTNTAFSPTQTQSYPHTQATLKIIQ